MILDRAETIQRYTDAGWWGAERISDLFLAQVEARPQQEALLDPPNRPELAPGEPQRYTFAALKTAVDRLAVALLNAGLQKDDVLMVQLPNVAELPMVYLAAARIGVVVSPLPVQYRTHELKYTTGIVQPKAFITVHEFQGVDYLDQLGRVDIPSLQTTIALGDNLPAGVLSLQDILNTPADDATLHAYLATTEWSANDIFTIAWTSGTEAEPKGVPRSHNHWIAISYFSVDGCEMAEGDRLLNPFPMVNMSAIGGMLVPWLIAGATLIMHHPLNLPVFLQQITLEKVTYTVAPPILMNLLLLKPQLLEKVDLSHIKVIGSGSAPLSPWMVSQWDERYNIPVLNIFGSNEGTALISTYKDIPSPVERASFFPRYGVNGYDWQVRNATAVETKLVDPDTKQEITEREQVGELAIKGPTIFPGYYQRDDLTVNSFDDDGYFYTGDLFAIDGVGADDRYRFVGRLKDVIVRGGMKISPEELEQLIIQMPQVQDVAVIGCPARLGEEQVVVVAVLADGQELHRQDIVEHLHQEDIASYKMPKRLEIVESLPRNPVGKVLKRELREQMCADVRG